MQRSRLDVLWTFAHPHLPTLIGGLGLSLLGSATALASPMITKRVLDALAASEPLLQSILALGALLVVGSIASLWQWILLGSLAERIVLRARTDMVWRFLGARVSDIASRPTGELVTRVTSDSLLLREATSSSVIGLINASVMLLGSLVLMGMLDLQLLGITLVAVVVVIALFALLMPGVARAEEQSQEAVGRLGGLLEGSLRAIRTVKASRAEERQAARILAAAEESATASIRVVRLTAFAWVIAWSGIQLAIIVILGFGAWRVSLGALEVSSLIAFLLYAFGLMGPIMELSQHLSSLQSGIAAAGRIREVQAIPLEADQELAALEIEEAAEPPALEFRKVTAAYRAGEEPAVRDLSFSIPQRGHVAIVGPSGAGKTTTFSLILRFIEPDAGEIRVAGRPYAALTHDEVRAALAYVEQDAPMTPGSIRDNLAIAHPGASDDELWEAIRAVRLEDKVASLPEALATSLTAMEVSGGQRQRIALARAILRTPQVLLLDEATAQLDGITESAVQQVIRDVSAQAAVVTIAHRLSTVLDADCIMVMEDGRIRAQGTHSELLATDELYRQLVEALRIDQADQEPALVA